MNGPLAATESVDLRDIKPLEPYPGGDRAGPAVAALALFAALLGLALLAILRRRARRSAQTPGPRTAAILGTLDELAAARDMPDAQHYRALVSALRGAVEARFGLSVRHLAAGDFEALVRGLPLPPDLRDGLGDLLRSCDPIVYGGEGSDAARRRAHLDLVRRVLDGARELAEESGAAV